MPENTINYKDELFIRDGQVFNREIFESPIGDIEKLLEEACIPQTHKILPLQFPSLLRNEWCMGHWFGMTPKGENLVFTEIQYIPFKGAHAIRDGDEYTMVFSTVSIPEDHWEVQNGESLPRRIKLDRCPKWYPPADCRFFIMYHPHDVQYTQPPMLFMLHKGSMEPIVPRIPNVFDTGNICTGESFNQLCQDQMDVFGKTKAALDTIRVAPANQDLRENDSEFIRWKLDEDKNPIQVQIPWLKKFGRDATDSRIIEFTKMIN